MGFYPSLKTWMPHPVPFDLLDPFGLQKNMSPEKKATSLVAEINNGRLAMLGIMGFVAAAKVPGSFTLLQPCYRRENAICSSFAQLAPSVRGWRSWGWRVGM